MNIEDLKAVEVPEGTLSYNQIDKRIKEKLCSLTGETEDQLHCVYLMSKKGDIASGTICSPALGLGVHWHHSYSKSLKFLMTIVAYGKKTKSIFASPDGKEFTFKKGIAPEEIEEAFEVNLKLLTAAIVDGNEKKKLTDFRKSLMELFTPWEDAAILGCFYFYMITNRLSPTQLSVYKNLMLPLRQIENFTIWNHFNCLVNAIDGTNPKTWLAENVSMSKKFDEYCKSLEKERETFKKTGEVIAEKVVSEEVVSEKIVAEEVVENGESKSNETPALEKEESPVEENFSEKKEEIEFENKKEIKSSLGFFKKITATKTSENTGKVKNVLVLPKELETDSHTPFGYNEPIVPIVEERTSNKPIIDLKEEFDEPEKTEELAESNVVDEIETTEETIDDSFDSEFDEVEFDEDLVDETPFDVEENDFQENVTDHSDFEEEEDVADDSDFEEKDVTDDSDFEEDVVNNTPVETNDSDFEDDFETEEEVNEKLAMYSNNKTPDQIVTSETVTMYRFEETKTTVVLENK